MYIKSSQREYRIIIGLFPNRSSCFCLRYSYNKYFTSHERSKAILNEFFFVNYIFSVSIHVSMYEISFIDTWMKTKMEFKENLYTNFKTFGSVLNRRNCVVTAKISATKQRKRSRNTIKKLMKFVRI